MTTQYAVIGYPLGYSLSPALHNYFFSEYKIDATYISLPLKKDQLTELFEAKKFAGFNVTIPYKEDVLSLCDELTETAKQIGAVNTVKLVNGKYLGTNTDAPGFSLMLKEDADFELSNKNILLLGAGGAAKAITYSALNDNCNKLFVYDISEERTNSLKNQYNSTKIATSYSVEDFKTIIPLANIIINATPIGMENTLNQSILNKEQLSLAKKDCLIVDIIYSPPKTQLLTIAENLGLKTLNGLGMLAGQGILAEKFWFSRNLRYNISKEVFLRAIKSGIPSK
ncbi:MAG: shikimate dehydrogenase [Candidatus Margulisbacteria bacterium]|nr:shikimate dehydrogenase [Candidatus Margulisiibacteriota bacterium]